MPDDDRDLHWSWFIAGAVVLVVLLLTNRRGRHWFGDRLLDAGLWLQRDVDNSEVEQMLTAWGQQMRKRRRRNGRKPGDYQGP